MTRRTWCCVPTPPRSRNTPACARPDSTRSPCSRRARRPTPAPHAHRRPGWAVSCRSRRSSASSRPRTPRIHSPCIPACPRSSICSPRGAWASSPKAGPLVVPLIRYRLHLELQAAPAGARLAQRPAIDVAGARPGRCEDRLGRPPRRPGREQQHQFDLHQVGSRDADAIHLHAPMRFATTPSIWTLLIDPAKVLTVKTKLPGWYTVLVVVASGPQVTVCVTFGPTAS